MVVAAVAGVADEQGVVGEGGEDVPVGVVEEGGEGGEMRQGSQFGRPPS